MLRALTFNGSAFTSVATFTNNSPNNFDPRAIVGDGYYIYVFGTGTVSQIQAFTFNGSAFTKVSSLTVTLVIHYQGIYFRSPYLYFIGGSSDYSVYAARMDLTAQFTADKLTGVAPLTINFNAI
jgi:PKD repeat protein